MGKVDLVMGSFSKTFASNGGFVASHSLAARQFIKYDGGSHTFSNALSPVQASIVLEALRIVRSDEGDRLRATLAANVRQLRVEFEKWFITCLGEPSAIVPVPIGSEPMARVSSALVFDRGVFANLVEDPAVPTGAARLRMQVMAGHQSEHIRHAAATVADAIVEAESILDAAGAARA